LGASASSPIDQTQALQPAIAESRQALVDAHAQLADQLASFQAQVAALTEKANVQAVKHILARTDEAARRSVESQGRAMADAARVAFGAALGATLQRLQVAAGEYATESEVIRDGLRVLLARDRAIEDWLRKDVAAACDALKANPSRAVAVGAVKARLAAANAKASKEVPTKDLIPRRRLRAGGDRPTRRAVRLIAERGSRAVAGRYTSAVVTNCERLALFPLRGVPREDIRPGLRVTHHKGRTVIAYAVDADSRTVSILGVIHGGHDLEGALAKVGGA